MECCHITTRLLKDIRGCLEQTRIGNECVYCFEKNVTIYNKWICLVCNEIFCENHVEYHGMHSLFLMVVREPLCIKVYCTECDVPVEKSDESFVNDLMSVICKSDSVCYTQESSHGLKGCLHIDSLEDQGERADPKHFIDPKCRECDLERNLWMCLSCGKIHCGRSQYIQMYGGNGHALSHHLDAGHSVALKLGSLDHSVPANKEVYCYLCDNFVINKNLDKHINALGVDSETVCNAIPGGEGNYDHDKAMSNQVYGKYIQEEEMEKGRGVIGIESYKNCCYMSTVIQVLFHINPFIRGYEGKKDIHFKTCTLTPSSCLTCQLTKIFNGMYDTYDRGILNISLKTFKQLMGSHFSEFNGEGQEDSSDFLQAFIRLYRQFSDFDDYMFGGKLVQKLSCSECDYIKYKDTDDYDIVPLYLNKEMPISYLMERLDYFMGPNTIDIECSNCCKSLPFTVEYFFEKVPKIFIVKAGRFSHDENWNFIKLNTEIRDCEGPINLDKFVLSQKGRSRHQENERQPTSYSYCLDGFIIHTGSIDSGHYISFVNNGDGEWLIFNDSKVTKTRQPPIGDAYLYFYSSQ